MSIIKEVRGKFELKSVIDEMYYCREDEIIRLQQESDNSIGLNELEKLPQDIAIEILDRLGKQDSGDLEEMEKEDTKNNLLYKQFYSSGFKDGVMVMLESLM